VIDVPGTVLITAAIASLTYGLIEAGNRGWGDSLIVACLVGAVVLGLAFVYVESKVAKPMVPLRFFKSGSFTGANLDSFAISFLIAGIAFFMTLYQQNVHGFSPVRAGLALLPMVIPMMIFSPLSAPIVARIGGRVVVSMGMTIVGIGQLLLFRASSDASFLDIVPGFVAMGFGMSFIWAPMTTAMLNSVDGSKAGVASAVNGAIREIGTAFGIALLGTIANRRYLSELNGDGRVRDLQANGDGTVGTAIATLRQGPALAGHVIESPDFGFVRQISGDVLERLRLASSDAFISGMERSFVISSVFIFAAAIGSYFLLSNETATNAVKASVEAELPEGLAATGD